MAKLHTPLCDQLGIRLPIIQAPMASGPSSPDLVAAVSQAGALGSFGFAYTQPEAMQRDVEVVRAHTHLPFNLNLFASPQPGRRRRGAARRDRRRRRLLPRGSACRRPSRCVRPTRRTWKRSSLSRGDPSAVLTFHLGVMQLERVRRFQALGVKVGGSATCVAEAEMLEALGVDFIVAQGMEAGGHRGTYLRNPYDAMTGIFALVRLIVRKVRTPVIAAGGIMDGAGIAAALALGAQGAQLGTAFVPCPESGAPRVHKDSILAAREDDTLVTEKFSGKPARGLANRFMREMSNAPQLPFPAQNALTGRLRAASAKAGNPDFVAMWSGQAAALSRALPAAELVAVLEAETLECLDRLAALRR